MKVLVVDDDKIICVMLERFFKHEGIDVKTAFESEQGIAYATAEDFDLILLDVSMPKMNGVEVTRQIRRCKPQQRIVMMTGYTGDEVLDAARKEGVHDFLCKPFDFSEIMKLVRPQ